MKNEEEISRMLASLKTVDAPENFEGAVRSLIAKRRDERPISRPSLLLVAKFALPVVLLLAAGGFLIISDDRGLSADMVPPVGDASQDMVAVIDGPQAPVPDTPTTTHVNSPTAKVPMNRGGGNSRSVLSGNSEDIGLSPDDTTVFPDGVDPRKVNVANIKPPMGRGISPISLLSMMGILSSCTPVSCQVRGVRNSSIAQKADIRVGDLVKKIGDRPIDSFHSTSFEVKSIDIVRNGKPMTISIARY